MNNPHPIILFFNINGSGMGHLSRCLSYARRLKGRATSFFFSLASAMELIEQMGFAGDYFISPHWTKNSVYHWNSELSLRLGLLLEHIRPNAIVFDGTWPYQGFINACHAYAGQPALIWSRRGLMGENAKKAQVDLTRFDLIIEPGELGQATVQEQRGNGIRQLIVPPVTLLRETEFLSPVEAKKQLGLDLGKRHVLLSLGPGNLKRVAGIGQALVLMLKQHGYVPLWAQAPIATGVDGIPDGVRTLCVFPLARYLRAFAGFIGAAGYNTCCELAQVGLPALLVPNEYLADDQPRRARTLAENGPVIVSACATLAEQKQAMHQLLQLMEQKSVVALSFNMLGAELATEQILQLALKHA